MNKKQQQNQTKKKKEQQQNPENRTTKTFGFHPLWYMTMGFLSFKCFFKIKMLKYDENRTWSEFLTVIR